MTSFIGNRDSFIDTEEEFDETEVNHVVDLVRTLVENDWDRLKSILPMRSDILCARMFEAFIWARSFECIMIVQLLVFVVIMGQNMIGSNRVICQLAIFVLCMVAGTWAAAGWAQAFKQNLSSPSGLHSLDGFIAKAVIAIPAANEKILFGILNQRVKFAEVRLTRDDKIISAIKFSPIGNRPDCSFSVRLLENKGFSSNPKLLTCNFKYSASGYPHGDVIIILKDNQLSYGLKACVSGSEDVTASYHYVFPVDKGGKRDRLTVVYTLMPRDESTGALDSKHAQYQRDTYAWDGKKLRHIAGSSPALAQ